MGGAMSRRKGISYEREIASRFTEALHHKFSRVLSETRDGNSGDIVCDNGKIPFVIQCKNRKAHRPDVAWYEAEIIARAQILYPIAVLRYGLKKGSPFRPVDLVVIELDDFLELCALIRAGGMWS